jgi:hypothetical protein
MWVGMNRKTSRNVLFIFSSFVIIVIAWWVSTMYFFTGINSNVQEPVYSTDGSKVIVPSVNFNKDNYETYLHVNIEIQDANTQETLFQVQTRASHRMRWSVKWIDNNTVTLESSDIGSHCWAEYNNETWNEIKCP